MGGVINVEISNVDGDLFAHGEVQARMTGEGRCIACGSVFEGEHRCTFDEHIMHTEEHWHRKGDGMIEDKENPKAFTDHRTGKKYVRSLDGNAWVEVEVGSNEGDAAVHQEDDGTR